MNILVTGAKGFIGKNLCAALQKLDCNVFAYDINSGRDLLEAYAKQCDFVFHLAGINRPQNQEDFRAGNFGFTSELLTLLAKNEKKPTILFTSSIQAQKENPYGISKKESEDAVFEYAKANGIRALIYRLPNVFGKWCRPNYNSVIATFCHNIANNLAIQINDPTTELTLVYIDDVVKEFVCALHGHENIQGEFCYIPEVYMRSLGEIAELIKSFAQSRKNLFVPSMEDLFVKKLYSTYLSYLPKDSFSYLLDQKSDSRGSFTEFLKITGGGQVSINISKPHVVKGNHWHHTKNEKFLVVSGRGVIRFRSIDESEVICYYVSGDKLEVVDIPVGYTHNIENIGDTDMVTVMWANEIFDPQNPDTFFLEV